MASDDLYSESPSGFLVESPPIVMEQPQSTKPKKLQHRTLALTWLAVLFFLFLAAVSLAQVHTLFAHYARVDSVSHREHLEHSLGLSLRPTRHGGLRPERLAAVRSSLVSIFNVLPKNQDGRLSAPVMRYMAHRYFSHKHGWVINGLSPHNTTTELDEVELLRKHVPRFAEVVLEGKLNDAGFGLEDAAILIGAVEQLIFDEVILDVESAYRMNNISTEGSVTQRSMIEVLHSYLIESMLQGGFKDARQHKKDKRNIQAIYPNWKALVFFVDDIIGADTFERSQANSPFARSAMSEYSFEDTSYMATRVVQEFGPWSNYECRNMMEMLLPLDPHRTGRVRLADFYKASKDGQWQFSESPAYLRNLGCLDESSKELGPQVILANYMSGMSNCIMSTTHYNVCCMSECERILRQFEARLQAPSVPISQIVEAAEAILAAESSIAAVAPSLNMSTPLRNRLEDIAQIHKGEVPVHGRLFAQWLHFAFPHECPYPHPPNTVVPKTPVEWSVSAGEETVVSDEQMQQHVNVNQTHGDTLPSPKAGEDMWSKHENLLLSSTPSDEEFLGLARMLHRVGDEGATLIHVLGCVAFLTAVATLIGKAFLRACRFFVHEGEAK